MSTTPPEQRKTREEQDLTKPDSEELKIGDVRKRTESRRIYRIARDMIPKDEWKLARPIPQENRASKARGTNSDTTRKRITWKKHWYSQDEPVKYDGETRGSAPKWKYSK